MKKINLIEHIIVINKSDLLNAINKNEEFCIDTDGKIQNSEYKAPVVFKGKLSQNSAPLNGSNTASLEQMFGKNYKLVEEKSRVLMKAQNAWQDIISWNIKNASYDDTTADGIALFREKELEDIGWHATEFHIKYREIVEFLEEKCDITLLCIEQLEPYQFSGLGFVNDLDEAKEAAFSYCKQIIEDKIKNDEEFAVENLSDDEEDAAKFFNAL